MKKKDIEALRENPNRSVLMIVHDPGVPLAFPVKSASS